MGINYLKLISVQQAKVTRTF